MVVGAGPEKPPPATLMMKTCDALKKKKKKRRRRSDGVSPVRLSRRGSGHNVVKEACFTYSIKAERERERE